MNNDQNQKPPLAERLAASIEKHGAVSLETRSRMEANINIYQLIAAAFASMMVRGGAPVRPGLFARSMSILMDVDLTHTDAVELLETLHATEVDGLASAFPASISNIPANRDLVDALKLTIVNAAPQVAMDIFYQRYFKAAMTFAGREDDLNYRDVIETFLAQITAGTMQVLGRVPEHHLEAIFSDIEGSASEQNANAELQLAYFKAAAVAGRKAIAELNEEEAAAGMSPNENPAGKEEGGTEDGV